MTNSTGLRVFARSAALLALSAACFAGRAAAAAPQSQTVYQESGGIVVVEMESIPVWSFYALDTSQPGYSGSGYYTWRGNDLPNEWPNFEPLGPTSTAIYFNITTPGLYTLNFHWWEVVDWNAVFLQMDDDPGGWQDNKWQLAFAPPPSNRWTWETGWDSPGIPSFTLAPGIHRLTLAGGTTGIGIDRFHLFLDTVVNPLDLSRPQSSIMGSSPPPPPPPPPPSGGPPSTGRGSGADGGKGMCGIGAVSTISMTPLFIVAAALGWISRRRRG